MDLLLEDQNRIYISNALNETELSHHLSVNKPNFLISTGQHPLYPKNSITNEILINLLEKNQLYAVGEIGFDKKNKDFEYQKNIFIKQTDIANQFHKPVIVHCVGYYYELYKIIKENFPKTNFILHRFQGSKEVIQTLSQFNVIFSLHESIIKIKNSSSIIKEIIENHRFAFETDIDDTNEHDVIKTMEIIDKLNNYQLSSINYQLI